MCSHSLLETSGAYHTTHTIQVKQSCSFFTFLDSCTEVTAKQITTHSVSDLRNDGFEWSVCISLFSSCLFKHICFSVLYKKMPALFLVSNCSIFK